MKKTVALCLAAILLFSLAACGKTESVKLNTVQLIKAENKEETLPSETPEDAENGETPSEKEENTETPSDGDKTPESGEASTPSTPSGSTAAKPTGGNKTPSQSGSSNSGSQTKPSAPSKPSEGQNSSSSSESSCPHINQSTKNFKYPTATETGYSGDSVCNNCGKVISSGETIAKTKVVSHDYYDIEMQIFNEVNAERTKAGLPALVWDENLYAGTKVRAKEYCEYYELGIGVGPHNRPDGRNFFTAITENSSYTEAMFDHFGENCAGNSFYSDITRSWMESSGHRVNVLRREFTRAAIAVCFYNNMYYATNTFVG